MAKWRTGFDKEIHDAWKKYRENGGKKGYNEYLVDKHKQIVVVDFLFPRLF